MKFIKVGILSTFQDFGRHGFQSKGINPNGVMDYFSFRLINILLDNEENEAVLEFHFPAPYIRFEERGIFVLGGADFMPHLNDLPIINWKPYSFKEGDILYFKKRIIGARCYLAFKGGFKNKKILGSNSTNILSKLGGKCLEPQTEIFLNSLFEKFPIQRSFTISNKIYQSIFNKTSIRFVASKEYDQLDEVSKNILTNSPFIISTNSNRMGYRLDGNTLKLQKPVELLSSGVTFGCMQLLPNGQIVILMADHQTTGGYPRIGSVAKIDLPKLAQMNAGDSFVFKMIDIEEAENLIIEQENLFTRLKLTFKINEKN